MFRYAFVGSFLAKQTAQRIGSSHIAIKNACGVPDLNLNFDQAKLEQIQKQYGDDLNVLNTFDCTLNSHQKHTQMKP